MVFICYRMSAVSGAMTLVAMLCLHTYESVGKFLGGGNEVIIVSDGAVEKHYVIQWIILLP